MKILLLLLPCFFSQMHCVSRVGRFRTATAL